MDILTNTINYILPLLALIIFLIGVFQNRIPHVLIAVWVSVITLILQYQNAGGEILGTYFTYKNATIYSLNLIILIGGLIYLCLKLPLIPNKLARLGTGLIAAGLVTASILLIINLWINAQFIEDRLPGTAIMQVVTFTPPQYCEYRYVFYKVGTNGKIGYLCPNHYGLIPSVGQLEVAPEYVVRQLTGIKLPPN